MHGPSIPIIGLSATYIYCRLRVTVTQETRRHMCIYQRSNSRIIVRAGSHRDWARIWVQTRGDWARECDRKRKCVMCLRFGGWFGAFRGRPELVVTVQSVIYRLVKFPGYPKRYISRDTLNPRCFFFTFICHRLSATSLFTLSLRFQREYHILISFTFRPFLPARYAERAM